MGACRDESGNYDVLKHYNGYSLKSCRVRCQRIGGCTAMAYFSDKQCALYRGGPYTQGTGYSNVQCYTNQGIFRHCQINFPCFIENKILLEC